MSRTLCPSCRRKIEDDPSWENWYYRASGQVFGHKKPKGCCEICGDKVVKCKVCGKEISWHEGQLKMCGPCAMEDFYLKEVL